MKEKKSIASQERMNDGQVAEAKRMLSDVLRKRGYSKVQGQRIIRRAGEFFKGIGELCDRLAQDWLEEILTKERQAHRNFFGQRFSLASFRRTLEKYGLEKIEQWRGLGLEPHFLPALTMAQDAKFPGWKVKPNNWYYQQVANSGILRQQPDGELLSDKEAFKLEGITVLVDTRLKPQYDDGKQMFENDNLLGPIIERLRQDGNIVRYDYGPQSSRFGVSCNEWERIKPELAKILGLSPAQVRLEKAIEANVIPQLYPDMPRHRDGETNTWIWYEEFRDDRARRLFGGASFYGGLAHLPYDSSAVHWSYRAVRPLAVL